MNSSNNIHMVNTSSRGTERQSRSPRPLLRWENVPIDWSHLSHLLVRAGSCAGAEGTEILTACPFACPSAAQLLPEEGQMVSMDTLTQKAFRSVGPPAW